MKKLLFIVIGVFVVIGIVSAVSGGSGSSDSGATGEAAYNPADNDGLAYDETPAPMPDDSSGVVKIIVKSTESQGGSVTYVRPGGNFNMSQDTSASFPWVKTFNNVDDLGVGWNMNAQQDAGGTLSCTVMQDGQVIAHNVSKGDYSMVTCSPE